jgi:hypothetical protein
MDVINKIIMQTKKKPKGKICISGDVFRSNTNIFIENKHKVEYDNEQDEYFIVFNSIEDRNKIIGELCLNKISYRESSCLRPAWELVE